MTFLEKLIENLNKDEKQVQIEKVSDQVEDYQIELEGRITNLESIELSKLKRDLLRLEGRELSKAKKDKENAIFDLKEDFNEWLEGINYTEKEYTDVLNKIESVKKSIEKAESKLKAYKDLLTKIS